MWESQDYREPIVNCNGKYMLLQLIIPEETNNQHKSNTVNIFSTKSETYIIVTF